MFYLFLIQYIYSTLHTFFWSKFEKFKNGKNPSYVKKNIKTDIFYQVPPIAHSPLCCTLFPSADVLHMWLRFQGNPTSDLFLSADVLHMWLRFQGNHTCDLFLSADLLHMWLRIQGNLLLFAKSDVLVSQGCPIFW